MRPLPEFKLPSLVARVGTRLPQWPQTLALVTGLNLALDRILPTDELAPLTGKRLQLNVSDLGLHLRYTFNGRRFRARFDRTAADLTLSAQLRDYLALALREEDPDTLFFSRRLCMEGNTDLGLLVKNTLDAVDWDALLARLPAARHLRGSHPG
ncbi:sterol-binding protein [Nitrogeniibacter mangrovi]|uniref:Ubiquinone biosynthesis accessory factor UbiT n=1 Tax=Nitrogeniibacter mangrovi TaxID=2016596 RepID=A0A6C1AZH5_9RHOO|nr:SCP2 sterol-binding domain-containing protein [Nitrogeniibacter mangrovi]QID16533.1 sterol-binding protein [Nitrogeniibacter mangrovi]